MMALDFAAALAVGACTAGAAAMIKMHLDSGVAQFIAWLVYIVAGIAAARFIRSRVAGSGRPGKTRVVVVGCGLPGRSMGCTHLEQLLTEHELTSRCEVVCVVEPFFMDPAHADAADRSGFTTFRARVQAEHPQVAFVRGIEDIPKAPEPRSGPCLAVVSLRTIDAPRAVADLIDGRARTGISHILLEKPAAPDAVSCRQIREKAQEAKVPVYVGYNKNLAPYARMAMEHVRSMHLPPEIELIHHNDFTDATLAECFTRCAEGALKNMACHELALAVCCFGLTHNLVLAAGCVEGGLTEDPSFTRRERHAGHTDFRSLRLSICLEGLPGQRAPDPSARPSRARPPVRSITITADRCGGDWSGIRVAPSHGSSRSLVTDAAGAKEALFKMPLDSERPGIAECLRERPEMRMYFATQYGDYIVLKALALDHAAATWPEAPTGANEVPWPEGLASIDDAVEVLTIAEYLEPWLCKRVPVANGSGVLFKHLPLHRGLTHA